MEKIKLNLQRFADPVGGNQIVYLFRLLEDEETEAGSCLAFTKENSRKTSVSSESSATKDGNINSPGVSSKTLSATAVMVAGDSRLRKYEKAIDEGKTFEIWEANLAEPIPPNEGSSEPTNKFLGTYFQGIGTSIELNSPAEGFAEMTIEFALNGKGADGQVTVSREQQETASYVFKDTNKVEEPDPEDNDGTPEGDPEGNPEDE